MGYVQGQMPRFQCNINPLTFAYQLHVM